MSSTIRAILIMALLLAPLPSRSSQQEETPPGHVVGMVLETMNAGGYTYVRLQTESGEIWAAGPVTGIAPGDRVAYGNPSTMVDFHSRSLDRTFASIEFVGSLKVLERAAGDSEEATIASAHGGAATAEAAAVDPVPKAEGGLTIAQLYAGRSDLAGKTVMVRGRVVKFNSDILGRTWIHIRDGSGAAGTNDLTVTTDATAAAGDVVLIRGTATIDKDFGMGYRYDLLVEDAAVTVE